MRIYDTYFAKPAEPLAKPAVTGPIATPVTIANTPVAPVVTVLPVPAPDKSVELIRAFAQQTQNQFCQQESSFTQQLDQKDQEWQQRFDRQRLDSRALFRQDSTHIVALSGQLGGARDTIRLLVAVAANKQRQQQQNGASVYDQAEYCEQQSARRMLSDYKRALWLNKAGKLFNAAYVMGYRPDDSKERATRDLKAADILDNDDAVGEVVPRR